MKQFTVFQVDFELGFKADFFIGSPFSSFSALIAHGRTNAHPNTFPFDAERTRMAEIDVADKLANIFAITWPYEAKVWLIVV